MGTLTTSLVLPSGLKPFSISQQQSSLFIYTRTPPKKHQSIVPVARLFGPAIFEASKLKVLFLGTDEKKHPGKLPRTYTLTHCDLTSKLTLAISQTINNSQKNLTKKKWNLEMQLQGWYHRLQRDEVIAEWKKVRGKMSLHVHCHISGGHFLLDLCASLRFFIFSKELPVVLKAFVHGDGNLFNNYPELEESWFGFIFTLLFQNSTRWNVGDHSRLLQLLLVGSIGLTRKEVMKFNQAAVILWCHIHAKKTAHAAFLQ
ncbi:unnamed protein product [Camellia sinensis]